jgi:hypothetical protein
MTRKMESETEGGLLLDALRIATMATDLRFVSFRM